MTWFRVDDSFYDHPKVFDLADSAVALWTRAGCWSARNLTDGFVPANMPARLCTDPETAVRELVDRGLWRRTRGGYRFHDWEDSQPTAVQVKERRRANAERQKRWREARGNGGRNGVTGASTPPVSNATRNAAPDPTRTRSPSGDLNARSRARGGPPRSTTDDRMAAMQALKGEMRAYRAGRGGFLEITGGDP